MKKFLFQTKFHTFYSIFFIALIVITLIMETVNPDYTDYSWKQIGFSILIMLIGLVLPPVNALVYRWLHGTDFKLGSYPRNAQNKSKLDEDLKTLKDNLDGDNKFFLVMTIEEKLSYTVIVFLIFGSLVGAFLSFVALKYGNLVNWLSITALGLGIYPIIEASSKNRISNKIAEIESLITRLNTLDSETEKSQLENKIDDLQHKIDTVLEKLKNKGF